MFAHDLKDAHIVFLVVACDFPGSVLAKVEPLVSLGKALSHHFSLLISVIIHIHSSVPVRDIINDSDC